MAQSNFKIVCDATHGGVYMVNTCNGKCLYRERNCVQITDLGLESVHRISARKLALMPKLPRWDTTGVDTNWALKTTNEFETMQQHGEKLVQIHDEMPRL